MSHLRQSISAISFPISLARALLGRRMREMERPRIRRGEEKNGGRFGLLHWMAGTFKKI